MATQTADPTTFDPDVADLADLSDAVAAAGEMPQLPKRIEFLCWAMAEGEGKTQEEIAAAVRRSQGVVCRAIKNCDKKMNVLVNGGFITRDRLIDALRRHAGLAPRT